MLITSNILITILFILCLILNTVSICLCLSALFLLLLTYFNFQETMKDQSRLTNFFVEPIYLNDDNSTTTTTTTISSVFDLEQSSSDSSLNLIFYLLFYLAVAILGIMGATKQSTNPAKLTYLTCHVLLLGLIIFYNLLAWFYFRQYSPLNGSNNYSDSDDQDLLYASLFDFIDFLIGFLLLILLIFN
uniref:Uncharacterized protein LOC113792257 n=1 Tax=Dermatophagoides pteronyssinus TaxID=6956 RepID=A0A6P6XXV7_DERPT